VSRRDYPPPPPPKRFWLGVAVAAVIVFGLIVLVRAASGEEGHRSGQFDPSLVASGGIVRVSEVPDRDKRGRIRHAVCAVFGSRCAVAWRVAGCETGGTYDPHALGGEGERGLFQIHPIHFGWLNERRLWEPGYNARIAWRLSRHGTDWGPWSCRP